jgi:hypothetical protein
MIRQIPKPISGGLILSYKCQASCRHCIYACSPGWDADWMSVEDLELTLSQLAGKILSAPAGPRATALNYGLHFTGGEPFLNFDLLCRAVETAERLKIPSTFVETNCFWATDDRTPKEKLKLLKSKGMKGIMISVNPFYLEYVPFERTERAVRIGFDVFGGTVMVYQLEYYRRFSQWGFRDRVPFDAYLEREGRGNFARQVEFFVMGRAAYGLRGIIGEVTPARPPEAFFGDSCMPTFLRSIHNHFDNYGNYVPGFCGGISLGDCRRLDDLLKEGIETEQHPVLGYLIDDDLRGLFSFARERGYESLAGGYFSKCHLCTDVRKHLALTGEFRELRPLQFYEHLQDKTTDG